MRIAWIYFPVYVNCRARHNYANPDGEWNPNVGEMHESLVQSEKSAQPNGKTPIVGARNARLRDAEVSVPLREYPITPQIGKTDSHEDCPYEFSCLRLCRFCGDVLHLCHFLFHIRDQCKLRAATDKVVLGIICFKIRVAV